VAQTQYPDPVLSLCWSPTNGASTSLICGCGDGSIKVWDAVKNQSTAIGKHQKAIGKVDFVNDDKQVLAMSYNNILALWDGRTNMPVFQLPFNNDFHPTYMTHFGPFIAVLAAEHKVGITSLNALHTTQKLYFEDIIENKLKKSYSSFEGFTGNFTPENPNGYIIGNIEGRCEVRQFIATYGQLKDDKNEKVNFTFKAHSEGTDNFGVNTVSYNKGFGTFITGVFDYIGWRWKSIYLGQK
jgi:mRNA export factor